MSEHTAADVQTRLAGIYVYPIKSCAGIALDEAVLTETGLDLDRAWMVVDEAGEFVSQREQPRLALVQPQFRRGGSELVLHAPGMLPLHLRSDAAEQPARVRVWDDEVPAYDMGDVAAQWFTDYLSLTEAGLPRSNGERYRLARFDPEQQRLSSSKWTGDVAASTMFSDGFALLVLSQASLDELNSRLQAAGQEPVDMARFRPNLILGGLQAHDEDRLRELRIETPQGPVRLRLVKPCARCSIPDIDPATALRGNAVGDVLQGYRQNALLDGAVCFGMNAIVIEGVDAVLRVGETCMADFDFGIA